MSNLPPGTTQDDIDERWGHGNAPRKAKGEVNEDEILDDIYYDYDNLEEYTNEKGNR